MLVSIYGNLLCVWVRVGRPIIEVGDVDWRGGGPFNEGEGVDWGSGNTIDP